jgi:hypothetical protein
MVVRQVYSHIGPLGQNRIAAMSATGWLDLRNRINMARATEETPPVFCAACGQPVYVRGTSANSRMAAHFSHFASDQQDCPWKDGPKMNPEAVRAAIFQGRQESEFHRYMCEKVLALAKLDPRYVQCSGAIDEYQRSMDGGYGRWPDVRFEYRGKASFVVEVQLAPISAVDVAKRISFYQRQGVRLIWLLPTGAQELVERWATADVTFAGRGTYFHIDSESMDSSESRRTLVLWATTLEGEKPKSKLVSLDDLLWTDLGHPFIFDRSSADIIESAERRRNVIEPFLLATKKAWRVSPYPGEDFTPEYETDRLLRVIFSVWRSARGDWENLLNDQPNLVAMINPYLNSDDGKRRAEVLEIALTRTNAMSAIRATTASKLSDAKQIQQIGRDNVGRGFVTGLFPEIFRDDLREAAMISGLLPVWASPS